MNKIQKQKYIAFWTTVIVYVFFIYSLYNIFLLAGIDWTKALIESVVISTTLITMAGLYLFGRVWKKEFCA